MSSRAPVGALLALAAIGVACGAATASAPRPLLADRPPASLPGTPVEALRAISRDIAALKPACPQLADFDAERATDLDRLVIGYAYHTHPSTRRGGWSAQVPNPDPDGMWFHLDLHDPGSTAQIHTQPAGVPVLELAGKRVWFLSLEGESVPGCSGKIWDVLRRYAKRPESAGDAWP